MNKKFWYLTKLSFNKKVKSSKDGSRGEVTYIGLSIIVIMDIIGLYNSCLG